MSNPAAAVQRDWREVDESRAAFREQIAAIKREWAAMPADQRVSEASLQAQIAEAERAFEERMDEVEWDIVDADVKGARPPFGDGSNLGEGDLLGNN
ncbi:MAG: hypothetical protein V4515_08185 [Chloroflexota bacterium]